MTKKSKPQLIEIKIVLPSSLERENLRDILSQIRDMSTRYTVSTPRDGKITVDAKCTPKQAHNLQNFSRSVLQAKQYDEGYDLPALRQQFEETSQGHAPDTFILPQDAERLRLQAFVTGMQAAILDFPGYREDNEVQSIAVKIGETGSEMWPEMTNDWQLWQEVFVPVYMGGYRYGVQDMNHMGNEEAKKVATFLVDEQYNGNGPKSLFVMSKMIEARMQEKGMSMLEDLLE